MSLPSLELIPSVPSATFTPSRSSSGTGQIPLPSFMFETGLWTMVTPCSPTSSTSPGVSRAREPLPLVPAGRLLALERCDQLRRDELLVEHDRLVVGAVAHPEPDQGAQAEIPVCAHDSLERFVAEPLQLVQEVHDAGR